MRTSRFPDRILAEPPIDAALALRRRTLLAAGLAAGALAACGGGGGGADDAGSVVGGHVVTLLAADKPAGVYSASRVDPNLVNGWGLAMHPSGQAWLADAGTARSTMYDGDGTPFPLVISMPDSAPPTGIVFNPAATDFVLPSGTAGASAVFIFASLSGTISGWAAAADLSHAIRMVDRSAQGSVYTGLALAAHGGAPRLYAADFRHGRIDVFDSNFAPVTPGGTFAVAGLPADYSPFAVHAIGDRLYVTYAQPDPTTHERRAAGLGALAVFDTDGMLIRLCVPPGGALNAPWGVVLAPAGFGTLGGALLVGNFGDGRIHAFDPTDGTPMGALADRGGNVIAIDGLWGLAFGTGTNRLDANALFFAAGPNGESDGVFGRIDAR